MRAAPSSALALVALTAVVGSGARADSLAIVSPVALPGPHPVACSNVMQDFSRMRPGEFAEMYWNGVTAGDGRPRYVTDLLFDRNAPSAPIVSFAAGADADLFGRYANQRFDVAYVVCYPTSAVNMRADYQLISGGVVPRMQRGSEGPIFPDSASRYPVLLFSHGLNDSPLLDAYLEVMLVFASHGYAVVAPFHGDPRIADIAIESFADAIYAALHLRDFVAMQTLRPLALQAVLAHLLDHPQFGPRLDPARVVGFGASLGANSLLLQAGAGVTVSLGLATKPVTSDPLLRAIVGYVPYFGIPFVPAFGRDQHGLDSMRTPFLGIGGTEDRTAPLAMAEQGTRRLAGSRGLVALAGVGHRFDEASAPDVFTWALAFLAAHGGGPAEARARVQRMTKVAAGGDDTLRVDYTAPAPESTAERTAVEYHHAGLDHYFVTADPAEAAMLDEGTRVAGWRRTGYAFKVWPLNSPSGLSACRFFGTPGVGPNSHFFTLDRAECAKVRGDPAWTFEAYAFQAFAPTGDDCPQDRMRVTRLYNNGKGGQANHRYLTSHGEVARMKAQGWVEEGAAFCTPP